MQRLVWEVRYAGRQLRGAMGFTVAVVLTLALGVGATTAIFSAVYGLLLKSLPFEDAGRIVSIASTHAQVVGGVEATFPDYEDWRGQQSSFSDLAAFTVRNPETVAMRMEGRSEQVHRVLASGNLFSLLGVRAQLGRTIEARDDERGSDAVAVLSWAAWQRYFGGDAGVVGKSVVLNGASFTVIGVLPQGGAYPAEGEVWLPLSQIEDATRNSRVWHSVKVLGRLKPGVTPAAARTDMETIASRLATAYPATNRGEGVLLTPLRQQLVGTLRPAMLMLLGAVLLVLLIACANVANLLMVRAAAHGREIAVRQALGADRGRLFAQFMTQTMLLCLMGGALGVVCAAGALPLLRVALAHTAGLDASMISGVELSVPVLLFTLAICVTTALLFGMLPLLRRDESLTEALKPGDRGSTGGSKWSRGALIAGEIAIAVVVLFLGSLVMRSYGKLLAVDPGFRTDHLMTAEITLPQPKYDDDNPKTARFYEQLLDRLQQAPGVVSAGTTTQTPLKPSQVMTRFLIEGAPPLAPGAFPLAQMRYVSPGFFQTMGLPVMEGHVFTQQDVDTNLNAVVVNEAFAKLYLSGRGAVGRKVLLGVMTPAPSHLPVLGVVANARDLGVEREAQPEIYLPGYGTHAVVLIRSSQAAEAMIPMLRSAVHAIDAEQPIYNAQTVDAVLSDTLARQRMTAVLLGIFACVALVLAAIGIYGVLAYSVAQRRREIGVRMAVGANRVDVLRLVLTQAGVFAVIGLAAGLGAAIAGARLMRGMLFETSAVDGASMAITIGGLAVIALAAASIPAARAASVDPAVALRAE